VNTLPTGNDTLTQTFLATEGACPSIPGASWNGSACTATFLRDAIEITDDGIGNDDLLCMSGERCLFSPNIGSYQGHGALVSAGAFTPGAITDVTLLRYETNGR
jgi:hypothetical protein